jgi:hypothetical protein
MTRLLSTRISSTKHVLDDHLISDLEFAGVIENWIEIFGHREISLRKRVVGGSNPFAGTNRDRHALKSRLISRFAVWLPPGTTAATCDKILSCPGGDIV